ncbi:hypothetical protein [Pseudomonas sp. GZD-222]|uniref:hypothetical protein n=1 Tax=Pseudomonas sp. GZD-222 TaxID=3404805 RepID=UPI003BB49F4B
MPWPSDVAARAFPSILDIGGTYAVDDLSAAEFLIAELSSAKSELSEQEAEEYSLMLHTLLGKLKAAGRISGKELLAIKNKAESIPVVGPLLFSTANLTGTLASVGGVVHAGSKATKVDKLLDLTDATRKKLKQWAATRGKPGSVSAHRAFRGRIKLIRIGGHLFFEVPTTAKASIYRVSGKVVGDVVHLQAYNTAKALSATAHVDSAAYSQRGVGRVLTGNLAGPLLAFGPQLALDMHSSSSVDEFLKKSAYSQPTNGMAFVGGVLVTAFVGGPAIVVITASLLMGVAIQLVMSDSLTGWGTSLGDFVTGKG